MKLGIKNKIALITGSSKNLGAAIALALAREGVKIILTGRDQESLSKVRDLIEKKDRDCICIKIDLQAKKAHSV